MHEEQLATAYRRHGPSVFRRARRLLRVDADAQEVVQEVFLSLVERPEQFRGSSSLTTFLYSATTHACLNRLRNSRTRDRLTQQHEAEAMQHEPTSPLTPEQLLELGRAMESMPDELAHAAVYYLVDGLTHDEIARLLSCSRRHVGNLLTRLGRFGQESEARA